jgi:hypothetical protein
MSVLTENMINTTGIDTARNDHECIPRKLIIFVPGEGRRGALMILGGRV